MTFIRKYLVEIICAIFFLGILIFFAPRAFASVDYAIPESKWQYEMSEKIYESFAQFELDCNNDRDHDMTDMDCALISLKLQKEIDRILFLYRNEILEEIDYQDLEEYKLEASQN